MGERSTLDPLVIGGGINSAIARDAAGRGLSVLLCEKDDLAAHTSSASTKHIHGGLRYLQYYEFNLVRKALQEREVLLRAAPHIIWPLRFVMPHVAHLRPAGVAGDQQAALFGQCCFVPGMVENTYGTGCFMLMNTGPKATPSHNKLLTTVAWNVNERTTYAVEGSVFKSAAEAETLAASVSDSNGVCLAPVFTGLGAPHWDPYARGTVVGLTPGTTAANLARTALEGIAFQVADVLTAWRRTRASASSFAWMAARQ